MKKLLLLFLALTFGLESQATDYPLEWRYRQDIKIGEAGLLKTEIPLQTLNAAASDLRDLRLLDRNGQEVAYTIESTEPILSNIPVREFRVSLQATATVAEFSLDQSTPIDQIQIITPAGEFIKSVKLEAASLDEPMRTIAEGLPVFRQTAGAAQTSLTFTAQPLKRIRLSLDDSKSAPIPLTGVRVQAAATSETKSAKVESLILSRSEEAGASRLVLEIAAANIRLAHLSITTAEPVFTRKLEIFSLVQKEDETPEELLHSDSVFRLPAEGGAAREKLSFAEGLFLPVRRLSLVISNGDSKPLNISGITAAYRPVSIIWLAQEAGQYSLLSGNSRAEAPAYDLGTMRHQLREARSIAVENSEIIESAAWLMPEVAPVLSESGAPIELGKWNKRRPLSLTGSGIQELELDPEVLEDSAADLRDLRLVRDGLQLPYLLERGTAQRSVDLQLKAAKHPLEKNYSRWELNLPYQQLPAGSIHCSSPAAYLERPALLHELRADDRGVMIPQQLDRTIWKRSPGQNADTDLVFNLNYRMSSSEFYLDIDNGDNPPLELSGCKLKYAASRIVFKAVPGSPVFLYYDNTEARVPRYEITLLSREILAAQRFRPEAGAEEELNASSGYADMLKAKAGPWFWVLLAAVAAILIRIVLKLLPDRNIDHDIT